MGASPIKRDSWNRRLAHQLWVVQQAGVQETADAAGISTNTLRKWRRWFDWDEERKRHGGGYTALIATAKKALDSLAEQMEDAVGADLKQIADLQKLMSANLTLIERIRKIERDVDYKRLALKWGRELVVHLEANDPEVLRLLQPHMKPFITEIARG